MQVDQVRAALTKLEYLEEYKKLKSDLAHVGEESDRFVLEFISVTATSEKFIKRFTSETPPLTLDPKTIVSIITAALDKEIDNINLELTEMGVILDSDSDSLPNHKFTKPALPTSDNR